MTQHNIEIVVNNTTISIASMTTYQCRSYAYCLRGRGHCISDDAATEQAYVILWMLNMYIKHDVSWQDEVSKYLTLALI